MKQFKDRGGNTVLGGPATNQLLEVDDETYLSYLGEEKDPATELFDFMANLLSEDEMSRQIETALVRKNKSGRDFFILNGDHRKQYEEIVNAGGGFAECYAYYRKHTSQRSPWSTDAPVVLKEEFRG